ncbi:unnamed protein product [Blepharisma stoltei]|uniref:Cyclic nucleotide-binding domain-containing protein n=1 Tax=Blepharisma stoltei TaxID=1481888 RepID=A0AAU9ITH6_9CILI|nr:unnamed protein product [Blepharisma stoltei]
MSISYDISRIIQILQIPSRLRSNEDIAYLMTHTSKIDFFKKITEEQKSSEVHEYCCQVMTFEEHNPEDIIVNFGENGSNFYIVLKGSASVNIPTKKKIAVNLRDLKKYRLKTFLLTLYDGEDEVPEINLDLKKKKRRVGRIFNAVDLNSLNTAMQEKKNEDNGNQQLNEFSKINDLFKDKIDEEKEIILGFLSKQNPGTRFVEVETEKLSKVAIINEGGSFGELSLISERPRAATIIAEEKIILGVLSKVNFKKILGNLAEKKLNEKIKFLQTLPMFSNWSKIALYKLGFYFSRILYKKHQFVYKEGDPANTVYFVKSGEYKITKIHSELKGVVDTSSLGSQTSRLSSHSSVLRLGKMRKKSIKKQLQLVIKGKNEMIGMEEALENFEKRIHSCQCISDEGEVFCISRDNLNIGITYPDTWAQIRDKHNANYAFYKQRAIQLTKIEEVKKSFDFRSLSKLPVEHLEKEKEETEKLKEPIPNIQEKLIKDGLPSVLDKQLKHSSTLTTPKHRRFRSSPGPSPCPYPGTEREKPIDLPIFKEDRQIVFYNRKIDTGTPIFNNLKSPQGFNTDSKRSTETNPYEKFIDKRFAPRNFFSNCNSPASSNRKADSAEGGLTAKFKDYTARVLRKYSDER